MSSSESSSSTAAGARREKPSPSFSCPCQISGMNEACGALPVQHPEHVAEVDLALADLEALAVDATGVGHVDMGDERSDRLHELVERPPVLGACELGMRGVEADADPELAAAARYVVAGDEQIVIALAAEMPGIGRRMVCGQSSTAGSASSRTLARKWASRTASFLGGQKARG